VLRRAVVLLRYRGRDVTQFAGGARRAGEISPNEDRKFPPESRSFFVEFWQIP
jgi:hypothetical protein